MVPSTRGDDRDDETDLKLYLPAGITPSNETGRLERLWERLFGHAGDRPN